SRTRWSPRWAGDWSSHSTVVARLAASAEASASQHGKASAKPGTGRSSIPETAEIVPRSRGVLDPRFRGDDVRSLGSTTLSRGFPFSLCFVHAALALSLRHDIPTDSPTRPDHRHRPRPAPYRLGR